MLHTTRSRLPRLAAALLAAILTLAISAAAASAVTGGGDFPKRQQLTAADVSREVS